MQASFVMQLLEGEENYIKKRREARNAKEASHADRSRDKIHDCTLVPSGLFDYMRGHDRHV